MELPRIATKEEWSTARTALLAKEEELAEARKAVNAERRNLPMVEFGKDYAFEGPGGTVGLLDLFQDRSQLLVYHFWFQPGEEPCSGCSMWVRNLGSVVDLHENDTSFVMVSRAPSAEIEAVAKSRRWTVPWLSVVGDDFNDDVGYAGIAQLTVFVRDGSDVYRTYATSGSVLETVGNHWSLLDLTPRGAG